MAASELKGQQRLSKKPIDQPIPCVNSTQAGTGVYSIVYYAIPKMWITVIIINIDALPSGAFLPHLHLPFSGSQFKLCTSGSYGPFTLTPLTLLTYSPRPATGAKFQTPASGLMLSAKAKVQKAADGRPFPSPPWLDAFPRNRANAINVNPMPVKPERFPFPSPLPFFAFALFYLGFSAVLSDSNPAHHAHAHPSIHPSNPSNSFIQSFIRPVKVSSRSRTASNVNVRRKERKGRKPHTHTAGAATPIPSNPIPIPSQSHAI
ncbi:hypothetical protein B0H34DRAFT_670674 [Crassisporium funariophilum]|nr:hypothetical protein B0H34DRAFT_670674 [Crassisporium funariophilum]